MATRSDNLPRRFARIYTAAITDVMDEMGLLRQTLTRSFSTVKELWVVGEVDFNNPGPSGCTFTPDGRTLNVP